MNYDKLVEVFNCDKLNDFRRLIKSQMKIKGYKNGFQIFHAFERAYPILQDSLEFGYVTIESVYQEFLDLYFKFLFED